MLVTTIFRKWYLTIKQHFTKAWSSMAQPNFQVPAQIPVAFLYDGTKGEGGGAGNEARHYI